MCGDVRRYEWSQRRQVLLDRRPIVGCEEEVAWLKEMRTTWEKYEQHGLVRGMKKQTSDSDRRFAYHNILKDDSGQSDTSIQLARSHIRSERSPKAPVMYCRADEVKRLHDVSIIQKHISLKQQEIQQRSKGSNLTESPKKVSSLQLELIDLEDKLEMILSSAIDWSKRHSDAYSAYGCVLAAGGSQDVQDEMWNELKLAEKNLDEYRRDHEIVEVPMSMEDKWVSFMKSLTRSDFYLAPDLGKFEVPYEVSRNTAVKYHALGKVYVFDAATYQKIDFRDRDSVDYGSIHRWPKLGADMVLDWVEHIPESKKTKESGLLKIMQPAPQTETEDGELIMHDANAFLCYMFQIFEDQRFSYAAATRQLLSSARFVGKMAEELKYAKLNEQKYSSMFEELDRKAEPEVAFK